MRFVDLSLKNKLLVVIVGSTLPALLIGFVILLVVGRAQIERDLVANAETVAKAVGAYVALPLAFDVPEEAREAVRPLAGLQAVEDVYIYDLEGELFVAWHRDPRRDSMHGLDPGAVDEESRFGPGGVDASFGATLEGGFVHAVAPVIFTAEGQRYGTIYVRSSAAVIDRRTRDFVETMAVVGGLIVLFAFAFAYLAQSVISRPILELARATERISRERDMSPRVVVRGDDEIGALSRGFNAMLDQLERRQAELERSNRDLDQFAYVASHDLKAPLRAIANLASWLEEDLGEAVDEEGRTQLRLMRSRVERLDRMIDGVLRYARVGQPEPVERVDLEALAREIVDGLAPPEGLELRLDLDLPPVAIRRARVEQVLGNLLSNAIRHHGGPPGRIDVRGRLDGDLLRLEVADDGQGIAPEHHERIFRMFQSLARRAAGGARESTGLGLALVRRIVDEEGGRVTLRSAAGEGATFSIDWPLGESRTETLESDSERVGHIALH